MKRILAMCLAGLFAGNAAAADLVELYRDALASDARHAAARAKAEAGREFAVQARAALLPSVGASAGTSWNSVDLEGVADRSYNSHLWGVQLTQPIFRMQNVVQARQGNLQSALAEVEYDIARQDLILRVAAAYFDVLNARDALHAVTTLRDAAAEQREIAKTSFEVGTVTITDVHEAQSRFDLASAQVIAAESELAVSRQALAQIIGRDELVLSGLRPGVELVRPRPDTPEDWVSAAEQGGLGVQMSLIARDLAVQEVERARAGHLPTLDLVASHGQSNRASMNAGKATSSEIGLQLNVPLYAGGALSSRDREAAARKVQADAELDAARREAVLAARQAFVGVMSGMAQVKALEAAEVSSKSALEATRLGLEVGVRINIDVLNAQGQLADTQTQLARARYDTLLAQLRLKAAAGTLEEADLAAINALLEASGS